MISKLELMMYVSLLIESSEITNVSLGMFIFSNLLLMMSNYDG